MKINQLFLQKCVVYLSAVMLCIAASSGTALADDGTGMTNQDPARNAFHAWANGNAYENHRDYAEDNGAGSCAICHDLGAEGYVAGAVGETPGCFTCHDKEWDGGPSFTRSLSLGNQFMNAILSVTWPSPLESHPDYVENNGVGSCVGCHDLNSGGKSAPSSFVGMGCLTCHGPEFCGTPGAEFSTVCADGGGDDSDDSGDSDSNSDSDSD